MPKLCSFFQVTIALVTILGAVVTLMNAQSHQASARMEPHVLIPLAHTTALVLLDTVIAKHVSTSVKMAHTTVQNMHNV